MTDLPISSELNERSKDDHAMIVGSEIRAAISELLRRIGELEEYTKKLEDVVREDAGKLEQSEAALAERDRMLKRAYDDVSLFPFIEDEPYEVGLDKFLADLKARAEEGMEG